MAAIIAICVLLLLSYIFEIGFSRIKMPSVIALFIMGWLVKHFVDILNIQIPDLNPILPLLGTLGLILVVLEGALELELSKEKVPIIVKSSLVSVLSILLFSLVAAYAVCYFNGLSFKEALVNVLPLSIISSAIAIPSAQNLQKNIREFVTYESSLSDILAVMIFNFLLLNDNLSFGSFGGFWVDILAMLAITFAATLLLSYLLSKIRLHVKFIPIIVMVILVYCITIELKFPALIFILLFGMFLANISKLEHSIYAKKLKLDFVILEREIERFKNLTIEATFLIRSLFFLLFGYLIDIQQLLYSQTFLIAAGVVATIYIVRLILLKMFRIPLLPILFLAPRGLITILLFISVPAAMSSDYINQSLIVQVIIMTVLIMSLGLVSHNDKKSGGCDAGGGTPNRTGPEESALPAESGPEDIIAAGNIYNPDTENE